MHDDDGLDAAAQLFKVLGSSSRLGLLRLLGDEPRTVGALAAATSMSQSLVSQHLRTLRQVGLVRGVRHGKEVTYEVADSHVTHVIEDALEHVHETEPASAGSTAREEYHEHDH